MEKSKVNRTRRVIVFRDGDGGWRYRILAANNRTTGTMGESMGKEHAIEAAVANAPEGVPVYIDNEDGTFTPVAAS